jgi:hypothetical protein
MSVPGDEIDGVDDVLDDRRADGERLLSLGLDGDAARGAARMLRQSCRAHERETRSATKARRSS